MVWSQNSDMNASQSGAVWADVLLRDHRPLTQDLRADVCVIGAGIAGLLTAERLHRAGKSVVVLDAQAVAAGETARTTAHVVNALDDRYTHLERLHGHDGAVLAAQSHTAAIDSLEQLSERLSISCDWKRVPGFLIVNAGHASDKDRLLTEELEAARRAGVEVTRVEVLPSPWPSETGGALLFPGQGQMHPLKLLAGVAAHLVGAGVSIHPHTRVAKIHSGHPATVETERGPTVTADHVVVATNTPIHTRLAVHTKQCGYQTYVVGFEVPKNVFPDVLWWDGPWEGDPSYHYVRLAPSAAGDGTVLIAGGEDHKTGQGPDGDGPFRRIEAWTRSRFPAVGNVSHRWSGEVMETADGLAFIGPSPILSGGFRNEYLITGDSGNGITHAAIAAILLTDLIFDRPNPWADLYDPARKVDTGSIKEFLSENLNTLLQYRDWFKKGDFASEGLIPRGSGGILVEGVHHTAVYKNEHGICTRLNARCTHLGGLVRWNAVEKTWDCPCHASRFAVSGEVIHGPANATLRPSN